MAIANITGNILTDSGVATSSLLPLTGGTLTGTLTVNNEGITINRGAGNGYLLFQTNGTDVGSIYSTTGGGIRLRNATSDVLTINSSGIINLLGDAQLPTGNFVQWLSYSDANSRSWGIRTNQTAVGDFAILSSSTNNDTLNTVRLRITNTGEFQVRGPGTLLLDGSSNNLIRSAGNSNLSLYASNNGTSGTGEMNLYTADTSRIRIFYDGYIALNSVVYGTTTSGTIRTLYIGNSNYLIGGISSVRKSKTNIENVSNVDWIYDLNPVTFNYRKADENKNYTDEFYEDLNYGLIAEDTAPVADFLINYNDKEDGTKEMIGIEYPRLIVPLLKAIQELKAEVEQLKQK